MESRQWSTSRRYHIWYPFNFYLNEVLTDLAHLSLGYELNGNRVNIFCYADDIALLALAPKLENLSLKINVEKCCNFVFKHKSRIISTNLFLQGHGT